MPKSRSRQHKKNCSCHKCFTPDPLVMDISDFDAGTLPCGGDFHCWVEDRGGEVVFDPAFIQYEMTRVTRHAMGRHLLVPWNDDYEREVWSAFQTKLKRQMAEVRRRGWKNRDWWEHHKNPSFRDCPVNVSVFMRKEENKGQGFRIRVGSSGWEKEDGSVWWEFGNGYRDHTLPQHDKNVSPDGSPEGIALTTRLIHEHPRGEEIMTRFLLTGGDIR
jgi:hypothetical protein